MDRATVRASEDGRRIGFYREQTDPVRDQPFAVEAALRRAEASRMPAGQSDMVKLSATVASLVRRAPLICAAPAGVAMALGVPMGGCSSSAPPAEEATAVVQTLRASQDAEGHKRKASDDDDVVTIGGGRARLGWSSSEHHLKPGAVAANGLTVKWESPVLDSLTVAGADGGSITYPPVAYGSPLLVKHADMPGIGDLSVIITTTGNGWIYAISASSGDDGRPAPGTIVWKTQLTTPAQVVGTGSAINPAFTIGVLSTPIIDLKARPPRIYVTSADAIAGWQVFAASLLDGSILPGWPVAIDDAALAPVNQNGPALFSFSPKGRSVQRGALNLSLDRTLLYVPFGGLRDLAPGWMVAVHTISASLASAFSGAAMTTPTANAGMWAPGGATVDDDGTIFCTTGNSPGGVGGAPGVWGESLLAWAPSPVLTLTGTYTPFNYCDMEGQDADLGGSSPVLIPPLDPDSTSTPRLAVFGSKQGNVYLVDRAHLPGTRVGRHGCSVDSTSDLSLLPPGPQPQFNAVGPLNVFGPYQAAPVKVVSRMHTTPAYFSDSDNHFVFVTGNTKQISDVGTFDAPSDIIRLKIVTAPGAPAYLAVDADEPTLALLNPSSPVVSSSGSRDPIVWVVDASGSLAESKVDGFNVAHPVLYAVDGTTMTLLWRTAVDELGRGGKFISPVIDDGQVYLATDRVRVYGMP